MEPNPKRETAPNTGANSVSPPREASRPRFARDAYSVSPARDAHSVSPARDASRPRIARDATRQSIARDANSVSPARDASRPRFSRDAYSVSPARDASRPRIARDTTRQSIARDANSVSPASDVYSVSTARDVYSVNPARDVYSVSSARDASRPRFSRDTTRQSIARDANSVSPARDAFSVSPARDVYSVSTARDVYSVNPARDVYSVDPARDAHSVSPARDASRPRFSRDTTRQSIARDAHSVSPARDANSVNPARDANSVNPARDANSVNPARDAHSVSPARDAFSVSPARDVYSVNPARDAHSVSPARDAHSVNPARDAHSVSAARDANSVSPARDAHSVSPARDAFSVSPARDASRPRFSRDAYSVSPARDVYSVDPARDANSVSPARDANSVSPARDVYSVNPARDVYSVDPARDANSVSPARDASRPRFSRDAYSVSPARDVYNGNPARNANSVNPARDANSVSPARDASRPRFSRDAYSVSPARDAHSVNPVRDTTRQSLARNANSVNPARDANSVSPARDVYNGNPARNANSVSPARDANSVSPARDAHSVNPVRDTTRQSLARNANSVSPARPKSPLPRAGRSMGPQVSVPQAQMRSRRTGETAANSLQRTVSVPVDDSVGEAKGQKIPTRYTVRQFQNNLASAIAKKDVQRFYSLLQKYNTCCNTGRIIDAIEGMPSGKAIPSKKKNSACAVTASDDARSLVDLVVDFRTGYTMTHLAVMSGEPGFVESCLRFGSAVHSYEDLNGDTALMLALWVQPGMAFEMLHRGQDINIARIDTHGRNLLHSAVNVHMESTEWPERLDFIKLLVSLNSEMTLLRDPFGYTPAMWALEQIENFSNKKEGMEIVSFLKETERATRAKAKAARAKKEEERESLARKASEEIPSMHSEMRLSDHVRFVLEGPQTRLICIALLLFLHNILYACDMADRRMDAQYRDAYFDLWFTVFNNIASCWNGSAFFMGLTHALCAFGAAIIFCLFFHYVVHGLLCKKLLRLPSCGAQSEAEKRFIRKSFGAFYAKACKGCERGKYFAMTMGAVVGVYTGAKLYNFMLHRIWPGQLSWALIQPTLGGLDAVTALRGFWLTTLMIDWYIFMFVFDLMYQQGSLNIYLPHHTFSGFAEDLNAMVRQRKKKLVEGDIYMVRMALYWVLLLLGWSVIAMAFLIVELHQGPAKIVFLDPIFATSWPGGPVAVASLCILLECIIICQEWTWPTFQGHPYLQFPGLVITTHHVWFLILVLTVLFSLDLRIISQHVKLLREETGRLSSKDSGLLFLSLLPAIIGFLTLALVTIRSSLWWESRGRCGEKIALFAEHMCLTPCPLQDEAAALLAKRAEEQRSVLLSRSLVHESEVKSARVRKEVHSAIMDLEEDILAVPPETAEPDKETAGSATRKKQQSTWSSVLRRLYPGASRSRSRSGSSRSSSRSSTASAISLDGEDRESPQKQQKKCMEEQEQKG